MNKAYTISLFLLLTQLSYAQGPNFFVDGARWVYSTGAGSEPGQAWNTSSEEQTIIHGDTAISGLAYYKLYTTRHTVVEVFNPMPPYPQYYNYYDSTGPSFLRFDTLVNRVYYLPAIDSTERLIYDFNLQVGDTTPMQAEYFPFTTVRLIDTVTVFGVPLRRLFLTDDSQLTAEGRNFILEGIGGSNGLTFYQPEAILLSGGIPMTVIRCFQYQDSIYAPYTGECPFIDFVSANHPVKNEDYSLTVIPNPTRGAFTVTISELTPGATFTLVDYLGREVQSYKLTDLHTTAHLDAPGIYFWRVEDRGQIIDAGKLICN